MSREAWWRAGVVATVLSLVTVALVAPRSEVGAHLLPFVVFLVLIIPAHELGHALAGALVGHRIILVRIGVGPRLFGFRAWGCTVEMNAVPFAGATLGFPTRPRPAPRVREWIFYAGGLIANLAIYLLLRRLFGASADDWTNHPYVAMASSANLTVMVMNAFPFRMAEGTMSDGYQLLTMPFWPRERVDRLHITAAGRPATEAAERGDFAEAHARADALIARYPRHPSAALVLGQVFHVERRHEEARAIWREGLALATDDHTATMLKNNVAWVDALLGRDEDLPEADQLSAEAFARVPEHPAIRGTRGSVLVRLGKWQEALPLLRASVNAPTSTARGEANSTAFLAQALALAGRTDEARRTLEAARALDPNAELLPEVMAAIEAGPGASTPATPPASELDPARAAAAAAARSAGLLPAWRRDARIAAAAAIIALPNHVAVPFLFSLFLAFFVELVPEPATVLALGAACAWAALVQASGQIHFAGIPSPPGGGALICLAGAVVFFWLYWRARRAGIAARTRGPFVLSILLTIALSASLFVDVLGVLRQRTLMNIHEDLEAVAELGMGLAALGALWLTSARRGVRVAACLPLGLVTVASVGASTWYFEHHVVAGIPKNGAAIVFAEPRPAVVLRERTFKTRGARPRLSPGGKLFATFDLGREETPRPTIDVGDFAGQLVEFDGGSGVFLDDERFLYVRRKPGASDAGAVQLAAVRPLVSLATEWTIDLPPLGRFSAALAYDAASQTIFVQGMNAEAKTVAFRTSPGRDAALIPLPGFDTDTETTDDALPVATLLGPTGIAALVSRSVDTDVSDSPAPWHRRGPPSGTLWLEGPERRALLDSSLPSIECAQPVAAGTSIWCLPTAELLQPTLLRIDPRRGVLERVPERMRFANSMTMLDASHLALLNYDELRVIDLESRRGDRLTFQEETTPIWNRRLVDDSLAIFRYDREKSEATIAVYAPPTAR